MTALENVLLIADLLLWSGVILFKAMQPPRPAMSRYELKRRAEHGDQEARYEIWRLDLLPRVGGLKWVLETLLTFAAITILFQTLKPLAAIIVSMIGLFGSEMIARYPKLLRASNSLYQRYEAGLLPRVERWTWLKWFRREQGTQTLQVGSRDELARVIDQAAPEVLSRDDRSMLGSQLAFAAKSVADVMTPRSMIDTVELDETIGPLLLDRLHRTGHSRFPVIDSDIDHVVGLLYLRELVGKRSDHETVKAAMDGKVFYIGEGRSLEHALHAFLRTHHHLFIVVNEYRETVGILSLEDVLEALIGRTIVDEFDEFDDLRSVASTNPKSNNAPKGKNDL